MAAPTSVAAAEVLVAAATATLLDGTNAANRQLVEVTNCGSQPITVVQSSSGAPTITAGKGVIIQPQSSEWFWAGQGLRLYAKVGPVAAGETAADQTAGTGTWVSEKV